MLVSLKILLVEDNVDEVTVCKDSVRRFKRELHDYVVDLKVTNNMPDAIELLDNSFDGAIIDLKLNAGEVVDEYQGNEIIRQILKQYRVPFAVLTGTPAQATNDKQSFFDIYLKGEKEYIDLFNDFMMVHKTGVTKIFGGRGLIETTMDKVFWDNIVPQFASWKEQSELNIDTEHALLRYSLNHLIEILDNHSDICVPEEMYIAPPASTAIKTGSIVQCKDINGAFIILSPACDLAIHGDDGFKTDRVLVCEIDELGPIRDAVVSGVKKQNRPRKIKELLKNNYTEYYHWLPAVNGFNGGIINFRKVQTYSPVDYIELYEDPHIQVVSHFIKDIISRYSAFYARQGQPDFPFDKLAQKMCEEI